MMPNALTRPLLALVIGALLPLGATAQQADPALPGRDQLAQAAQGTYRVSFENRCSETLELYVYYDAPGQAGWRDAGSYLLEPGVSGEVFQTDNPTYYYYAQDRNRTWDGETPHRLPGSLVNVEYREKRIDTDRTGQTVVISCSDTYDQTGLHRIRIFNDCARPYRVMLHYKDPEEGWKTDSWWTIESGKTAKLLPTRSDYFYLYAEAKERAGQHIVFNGPHSFSHKGRDYPMQKVTIDSLFTVLRC